MRHRVALVTMALGCVMAGNALAFDATPVIYDLSALQEVQPPQQATKPEQGLSLHNLPLSTPSMNSGNGDMWSSDGDLELRQPQHHPRVQPGAGSPPSGQDPEQNPTPNPEPGTMLLLGTALASGARYARQRRKA